MDFQFERAHGTQLVLTDLGYPAGWVTMYYEPARGMTMFQLRDRHGNDIGSYDTWSEALAALEKNVADETAMADAS